MNSSNSLLSFDDYALCSFIYNIAHERRINEHFCDVAASSKGESQ